MDVTQPDPEPVSMERIIVEAASYGHLFGPDPSRWPPFALRAMDGWVALYETSTHRKRDGLMPTRETPTHSPGPCDYDDGTGEIVDATGDYVCIAPPSDANRRLILKAPDLLAACRRWLLRCESGSVLFYSSNYAEIKALVDHIDGGGE